MDMIFTVTAAGRAAILNAASAGLTISLTNVSVGTGSYAPVGSETALQAQQAIVAISQSAMSSDGMQLDLGALFDGSASYWIREVGVWAGNTLVFIWSDPSSANYLAYKNANVDFLFGCSIALPNLPAGVIQITDSGQALGLVMAPYDQALAALAAEITRLTLRDANRMILGR
jgi:hypothetical protein